MYGYMIICFCDYNTINKILMIFCILTNIFIKICEQIEIINAFIYSLKDIHLYIIPSGDLNIYKSTLMEDLL